MSRLHLNFVDKLWMLTNKLKVVHLRAARKREIIAYQSVTIGA